MTSVELGILAGFAGSTVPEVVRFLQDRADKLHELTVMKLQMKWERQEHQEKQEEISVQGRLPGFLEQGSFGRVSAFVRPAITLAFFTLFAVVRIQHGFEWTEEDGGLFATIITFWFGGRGFARVNGRVK